MIKELQIASRVICKRLREKPYQKGVRITAWQAIIEQILDGRRRGTFSWHKSVGKEINRYIEEMDTETKLVIWNSSKDAEVIPNADIDTITECLYPHVFHGVLPAIHRAVRRREKIEGEQTGGGHE